MQLLSRRRFLAVGLGATGAVALAACGAPATPTPAPKPTPAPAAPPKPAEAPKPPEPAAAAAKPTEATKPAEPPPTQGVPGTRPAAAPAAAPATKAGPMPKVVIWRGTDYIQEVTSLMKSIMEDGAKQNNIDFTFELKEGNWGDQLNAAVQAGTPPDIHGVFDYQAQYWRGQNQSVDVTDVSGKLRTMEGGYFDYIQAADAWQGKWWAVPLAINAWPLHVRQDLMDAKGLKWPKDWDEFRKTAREIQNPPNLYAFGYTLGRIDDTNNHVLAMLWTFGGQLQTEDGKFAPTANDKAWLETLKLTKAMFEEDKIIPPGAVTWDNGSNNNAYQSGQIWATSNPTSIYTWLVKNNKPDLVKGTKFYPYPKGPAGEFGQVDVWAHIIFKASKAPDAAKTILEYFNSPPQYRKYITDLQGRFLPVFRNMVDDPMWKNNPLYEQYTTIAKNGRIMAHAASPTAPYGDVTTNFLIGDMMQELLVKKQSPEQALSAFLGRAKAIYDKYPTL
ncbi:MAG TPA: extracellular solute-binding protein [Chloroflexota bacterium]|jgi:multiple sugar transport system substrate-binding protein|nr:extracellular solute-binding protein [Chloroflexota bacterium]